MTDDKDFAELKAVLAKAQADLATLLARHDTPEPFVGTSMKCDHCAATLEECITDDVPRSVLRFGKSYCCDQCRHVQRHYQAASGRWIAQLARYIPDCLIAPEDDVDPAVEAVRDQHRHRI